MKTEYEWSQECSYIARVTEERGHVSEMNYSKKTFLTYCRMMRDWATRQGFYDSAQYIQHCIDDLES